MKTLLSVFALSFALAVPALAATDDELKQVLIGTWGDQEDCLSGVLVFNADGSFSSRNGSDPTDRQDGTYTIKDGKLNGTASDHEMPEVTLIYEDGNLFFQREGGDKDQLHRCATQVN